MLSTPLLFRELLDICFSGAFDFFEKANFFLGLTLSFKFV